MNDKAHRRTDLLRIEQNRYWTSDERAHLINVDNVTIFETLNETIPVT